MKIILSSLLLVLGTSALASQPRATAIVEKTVSACPFRHNSNLFSNTKAADQNIKGPRGTLEKGRR